MMNTEPTRSPRFGYTHSISALKPGLRAPVGENIRVYRQVYEGIERRIGKPDRRMEDRRLGEKLSPVVADSLPGDADRREIDWRPFSKEDKQRLQEHANQHTLYWRDDMGEMPVENIASQLDSVKSFAESAISKIVRERDMSRGEVVRLIKRRDEPVPLEIQFWYPVGYDGEASRTMVTVQYDPLSGEWFYCSTRRQHERRLGMRDRRKWGYLTVVDAPHGPGHA